MFPFDQKTTIACLLGIVFTGIGVFIAAETGLDILGNAMAGAGIGLIAGFLYRKLTEPRTHNIPAGLLQAIHDDLDAVGYYRSAHKCSVELKDETLIFEFTSTIIPVQRHVIQMRTPGITASWELVSYLYAVDGVEYRKPLSNYPLKKTSHESFKVIYKIDRHGTLSDTHEWGCAVDGFSFTFINMDEADEVSVTGHFGPDSEELGSTKEGTNRVFSGRPSLPRQGIEWRICFN